MKRFVPVLAVCLLLGISSGAVMAYLISDYAVHNELSASDTEIEITEEFDPPKEIHPGTMITKIPKIKNLSDSSCYVRIRYEFSDREARQFCEPVQILDGWTQKEDGYYYWKEAVQPQESTGALFENIRIRSDVKQEALHGFDVLVYAEAIQSKGMEEDLAWKKMME